MLLPGIWFHRRLLAPLAFRLQRCGFPTRYFGYRSVRLSPAENARALAVFVLRLQASKVHFVAHSLGGVVLLHLLAECPPENTGRVVMLGSPLAGSRSADRLLHLPLGRYLLGRSVEKGLLGSVPNCDGRIPVGMIAGTRPLGLGRLLGSGGEPGDGTVALAETRVPGLADHVCVSAGHTGLILSAEAARQTCHFLRHGRFDHSAGKR